MAATTPNHDSPRIILFVWSIPHYRAAVYRRLSQNPAVHFTVCTGDDASTPDGRGTVALADQLGAAEGIRRRIIHSRRLRIPLLRGYEWQPDALRITWRERPDAVITFGMRSLSNWLLRVVCKLRGVRLLDWGQGLKGREAGPKWWVRKLYLNSADALLLYGTWARDFSISRGLDPKRIFVIRNSLDHEAQVRIRQALTAADLTAVRERFGVRSADDRLIIHSGRLEPRKNLPLLIEALARLHDRNRNVIAVLVGDGQEETRLHELAAARGVTDRVHFLGAVYDEMELAKLFSAADLCVAPGAVGLLAMHSLVYGTPILTCENTVYLHGPEVETIVEGRTGGYFRADDVNELARRMDSMLYPSPCKPRMSAACMRAIDEHYTPAHQELILLEALNSVLPLHRRLSEPPA